MNKLLYNLFLLTILFGNDTVIDSTAPTFYLRTLGNKSFFLSKELKKQKPIVLSFFATWCVPCRKEMPKLDSLSQVFKDVSFYLINVSGVEGKNKEEPEKVKKMLYDLKVDIPVLMDMYAKTAKLYEALILPTTVIINPNGEVIYKHTGYEKGDELEISKVLLDLEKIKEELIPNVQKDNE